MDVDVGGGLRFEVRVRRMDMLILVRCAVHSAGRVSGRDSHLGCWLAVEMVIDGRLRQGKALFSKVEFGDHTRSSRGRQASRLLPSTPAFPDSFFATSRGLMKCIFAIN